MPQGDWWIDDAGTNLLKGIDDDVNNPAFLEDSAIVDFLIRIPAARDAFLRMVGNMLPEEQARLMRLYACATPPPSTQMDPNDVSDAFQHRINTSSVRTSGPRGGGSWFPR